MNTFKLLWTSLAQLAASLANLAETVNGIDGQLRQRTGLDDKPAVIGSDGRATQLARGISDKPVSSEESINGEDFGSQAPTPPAARKRRITS